MPQVINQPRTSFWDTFAQASGPQLGEALNTGLTAIAQHKLGQLMERQQQSQLSNALQGFGYTPEQATQLAQFGPQLLSPIIKEQSRARVSQETTAPGLQAIVPGLSAQEAQAIGRLPASLQSAWYRNIAQSLGNIPQEEGMPEQYARQEYEPTPYEMQQQSAQTPADLLSLLQGTQQPGIPDIASILGQQAKPVTPATPFTAPTLTPESPVVQELSGEERKKELLARREAEKARKEQAKEEAAKRKQTLTERAFEAKTKAEQAKALALSQKEANKETKGSWDSLKKAYESGKEIETDLQRMEKLINKGKITPYAWNNLLETIEEISPLSSAATGAALGGVIGGPLGGATAPLGALAGGVLGGALRPLASLARSATQQIYPDTDEFNKLSDSFVRYAKNIFPGRVTDTDLRAFMRTVVNLSQTDVGKKRIIEKMRLPIKVANLKYKAARDIIKENGGNRPFDFDEQIEERTSKDIDQLAKRFIEGMNL